MIRQTIQNTIQNTIRSTLGDDAFSILDLFTGGRQGVWYSPSDLATLYQTHKGGSPVTANGDAVGLILDKSQGESTELVSNGDFTNGTNGWTPVNAILSVDSLGLSITDDGLYTVAYQAITTEIGKEYVIQVDLIGKTSAGAWLEFGIDSSIPNGSRYYESGIRDVSPTVGNTYSLLITATSSVSYLAFGTQQTNGITINNVSVREVIGIPATQSTASQRPTYNDNPDRLTLDLVDDSLAFTVPTGGWDGYMVVGTDQGTASYGVSLPAGDYDLGGDYFFGNSINQVVVREGVVSSSDLKKVEAQFVKDGAKASYGDVTDFAVFWRGKNITEFPLIDTSSGTNFYFTWSDNNLTSFPLLDTSSGTNFYFAWRGNNLTSFPKLDFSSATQCSYAWAFNPLVEFPANVFDNCPCVNFHSAFVSTNLSQQSIDNILVSILTGSIARNTTNGTLVQSGGSAPSAAGEAAIDGLVTRGWTVTVTGGYQGKILPAGLFDNDENGFWYSMDIGA